MGPSRPSSRGSLPMKMLPAMSTFGASISSWWIRAMPWALESLTPRNVTGLPSISIVPSSGG